MTHLTDILTAAQDLFGVTPEDLRGPRRQRPIAYARFAVAWALRQDRACSFAAIGAVLGGRNHTTVMYAVAQAERLACRDADYALKLAGLLPERRGREGGWTR